MSKQFKVTADSNISYPKIFRILSERDSAMIAYAEVVPGAVSMTIGPKSLKPFSTAPNAPAQVELKTNYFHTMGLTTEEQIMAFTLLAAADDEQQSAKKRQAEYQNAIKQLNDQLQR